MSRNEEFYNTQDLFNYFKIEYENNNGRSFDTTFRFFKNDNRFDIVIQEDYILNKKEPNKQTLIEITHSIKWVENKQKGLLITTYKNRVSGKSKKEEVVHMQGVENTIHSLLQCVKNNRRRNMVLIRSLGE